MNTFEIPLGSIFLWAVLILCLILFARRLWKRRWIYYQSWTLPGPFSVPIIGSPYVVFAGQKGLCGRLLSMLEKYPSVFRMWIADQLFIITSRAADVEYLLVNCLQKKNILLYTYAHENFNAILTQDIHLWQPRRKNMNRNFSQTILNSFFDTSVKYADKLIEKLEENPRNILNVVWENNLNNVFETIGGYDVEVLKGNLSKFIPPIIRYEELAVERLLKVMYYQDFFWKRSAAFKELTLIKEEWGRQIKEIVDHHRTEFIDPNDEKQFITCIKKENYTPQDLEDEVGFMFVAASETSALLVCNVLMAMSIYPHIQSRLYEELSSFSEREFTHKELDSLDYLDRVIKETSRLFPVVPFISRYVDKTVEIDSQVYPEGSAVFIPIIKIHRKPEYWPDPYKFDPDRFLPEQSKNRPRCAFIPFSYGPRNCIGYRHGIRTAKILLAKVLGKFEVLPNKKYKSLHEIEMVFHILGKPAEGYHLELRKRP